MALHEPGSSGSGSREEDLMALRRPARSTVGAGSATSRYKSFVAAEKGIDGRHSQGHGRVLAAALDSCI